MRIVNKVFERARECPYNFDGTCLNKGEKLNCKQGTSSYVPDDCPFSKVLSGSENKSDNSNMIGSPKLNQCESCEDVLNNNNEYTYCPYCGTQLQAGA